MLLNSFSILFIDFFTPAFFVKRRRLLGWDLHVYILDNNLAWSRLVWRARRGGAMATEHRRIAFKLSMFNLDKWLSTVVAPELNFIIRVLK